MRHSSDTGNQRSIQRRSVGVEGITAQVHYEFNITLDATHVDEEGAVMAHVKFFTKKELLTPSAIEISVNNGTKTVQASSLEIEPDDYYCLVDDSKKCVVNFNVTASLPIAPGDIKKKHFIVFEIEDSHHLEEDHDHDHDDDHDDEETLEHYKEVKAGGTHRSEHITIQKIQLLKKKK